MPSTAPELQAEFAKPRREKTIRGATVAVSAEAVGRIHEPYGKLEFELVCTVY